MSARVFVVGGANLDLVARSTGPLVPNTSNPGTALERPGGVGRNVAENLARLGVPVHLVAAIGKDRAGDVLRDNATMAGIGLAHAVTTDQPTGRYAAVLTHEGELAVGVNDMQATESLDPDAVRLAMSEVTPVDIVVLDANVPPAVVSVVAQAAADAGARLIADPVSVAKGPRMWAALHPRPWMLTPNIAELQALTGRPLTLRDIPAVAAPLIGEGVTHVWVKLGATGSVLVTADPGSHPTALAFAAPVVEIADVTGGGDALLAGFLSAVLDGRTEAEAAAYGHVVAALTVTSDHTVRPDLTRDLVHRAAAGEAR